MYIPTLNGKITALSSKIAMQSGYQSALRIAQSGASFGFTSIPNQAVFNVGPTSTFTAFCVLTMPLFQASTGCVPMFGSIGIAATNNGYWVIFRENTGQISLSVLKDANATGIKNYPRGYPGGGTDYTLGDLWLSGNYYQTPELTRYDGAYSIGIIFDGTLHGYHLYINGVEVPFAKYLSGYGDHITSGGTLNNGGTIDLLPFNNWNTGTTYTGPATGYLSHFSYFNTNLSAANMLALSTYSGQNAASISGCQVALLFENHSGATIKDYSGNGYNATINSPSNVTLGAGNQWVDPITLSSWTV